MTEFHFAPRGGDCTAETVRALAALPDGAAIFPATTRLHGRIVIRCNRFAAASEAEAISVTHVREASVGDNEFDVEM